MSNIGSYVAIYNKKKSEHTESSASPSMNQLGILTTSDGNRWFQGHSRVDIGDYVRIFDANPLRFARGKPCSGITKVYFNFRVTYHRPALSEGNNYRVYWSGTEFLYRRWGWPVCRGCCNYAWCKRDITSKVNWNLGTCNLTTSIQNGCWGTMIGQVNIASSRSGYKPYLEYYRDGTDCPADIIYSSDDYWKCAAGVCMDHPTTPQRDETLLTRKYEDLSCTRLREYVRSYIFFDID